MRWGSLNRSGGNSGWHGPLQKGSTPNLEKIYSVGCFGQVFQVFKINLSFSNAVGLWGSNEISARFVSEQGAFEFHYFFMRKFWMAYKCMGLVVMPGGGSLRIGKEWCFPSFPDLIRSPRSFHQLSPAFTVGFGSLDELFEMLVLLQTKCHGQGWGKQF